jgi:hypothetical protein
MKVENSYSEPTQLSDKPNRELTFGEKLVGLTFNPSGDEKVTKAKQLCAELADLLTEVNNSQESSYLSNTFYGGAIRRILDAQMYSVKFLTNRY